MHCKRKEIKVSLVLYYIGIRSLRDKRRREGEQRTSRAERRERADEEGRDNESSVRYKVDHELHRIPTYFALCHDKREIRRT
jgi:flagellar biosynthesis/type III secretory pathway M-ring protein FliF/YscJ